MLFRSEKGLASDSFKRACVNWGIGRELYTAPFIWVEANKCNLESTGKKDKYGNDILTCKDKFFVEQVLYDENRNIVALSIGNRTTMKRVFLMDIRKQED